MSPLTEARSAAAAYLAARARDDDARLVKDGRGDDFPEVGAALAAIATMSTKLECYRRALVSYADPDFWDAEVPQASLAYYDAGEIARNALVGRELFALHRD